jgi:hypothetical protein
LLELWVGYIGPRFDEYTGYSDVGPLGVRAIRLEVAHAVARLAVPEPKVASIIRQCIARGVANRPSPNRLLKSFNKLQKVGKKKKKKKGKGKSNRKKESKKRIANHLPK